MLLVTFDMIVCVARREQPTCSPWVVFDISTQGKLATVVPYVSDQGPVKDHQGRGYRDGYVFRRRFLRFDLVTV